MKKSLRAVRGAIDVSQNNYDDIVHSAKQLLEEMLNLNCIEKDDVPAIIFSATRDLNAAYPAIAARELGWTDTALMCFQEMDVKGNLPMCIRVMLLWNTVTGQNEIRHVYLGKAKQLRTDLINKYSDNGGML